MVKERFNVMPGTIESDRKCSTGTTRTKNYDLQHEAKIQPIGNEFKT